MKKLAIVIALIILVPSIAQAKDNDEPGPKVTQSTPRQFTQTAVLPSAGGAELTIVTTAGNEGQAKAAMSQAFGHASTKASALMAEVSKVNAQPRKTPIAISPELFSVLDSCRRFSIHTDSAFDITSAPKTEGFSNYFFAPNWRKLKLNKKKQTVTIKSDKLEIDPRTFGLVLRGFLADDIITSLNKAGWNNVQIRISNVTRSTGRDIHTPWRIRMDAPTAAEAGKHAYRAYDYSVGDVASAMISPRLFPQGIVDPRTRTLVTDPAVINAIVFAKDASTATAYAIATYAKSATDAQRGANFITARSEVKGILIAPDGEVITSAKFNMTKPTYAETKTLQKTKVATEKTEDTAEKTTDAAAQKTEDETVTTTQKTK